MDLSALAMLLVDDPQLLETAAMSALLAAFAENNPGAAGLAAAWQARPPGASLPEWLAERSAEPAFHAAATDLALSVLLGAVYVNKKAKVLADPSWAFIGRFWTYTGAHAPALSAGPFGHWAFPPGSER